MITSQIIGGIGNQMFQYAFGKYVSILSNQKFVLDIDFLGRPSVYGYQHRNFALQNFNIKVKIKNSPFHVINSTHRNVLDYIYGFFQEKITSNNKILQDGFCYKDIYFSKIIKSENNNINNYLMGFWQSEKFWEPIANIIKDDFTIAYKIPLNASELIAKIKNTNSVAINIRRADFVKINKIANIHDVCTVDYYQKSIDFIYDFYPDCEFFVFSDDMNRCQKNLNFSSHVNFVYPNIYKGFEYELYMHIMSQCKHFIIPNSSFAWRSVYLLRNENKKVIIPNKRFNSGFNTKDLIPTRRNATIIQV